MRNRDLGLLLVILSAMCVSAFAQVQAMPRADSPLTASPASNDVPEENKGTFSARVREVNVLFSASDWRGHFVSNITPSEVKVFDNGHPPESLTYFLRQSDLPLKVTLLIDVSGSVGNVFRSQQQAAAIFLKQTLRPSDSASITTFGVQSHVVQDFSSNLVSLTSAVRRTSAGESLTAVYDAVSASCARLASNSESGLNRRALILITDGQDNSSRASIDEAINVALQSEVVIFALNTSLAPSYTDPFLQKLTASTGGGVLHARGTSELKSAFRKVNEQLRNQYLLGYKPPNWQADRSFHKIRLSVRRFGLQVHCRKGYYAIE